MLSLFSLSDIIGRFSIEYYLKHDPKSKLKHILVASFVRIILIYTSLMIGFRETPHWLWQDSDTIKIINAALIGLGNGFLGTLLMILGPYKVPNNESERAG